MRLIQFVPNQWTSVLILTVVTCLRAQATDLNGTTVFGFATPGNGLNYFDPTAFINGEKDGTGTTVVIGARHPTFSGGSHDYVTTADFTDTSLTVTNDEYAVAAPGTPIAPATFQDPAFAGLTLEVTGFSGFTSSGQFTFALSGDTVSFDPTTLVPEGFYSATVEFISTPEPSTFTPVLFALLGGAVGWTVTRRVSRCV